MSNKKVKTPKIDKAYSLLYSESLRGRAVSIDRLVKVLDTPRNCVRARITELRQEGQPIVLTQTRDGRAAYRLSKFFGY